MNAGDLECVFTLSYRKVSAGEFTHDESPAFNKTEPRGDFNDEKWKYENTLPNKRILTAMR